MNTLHPFHVVFCGVRAGRWVGGWAGGHVCVGGWAGGHVCVCVRERERESKRERWERDGREIGRKKADSISLILRKYYQVPYFPYWKLCMSIF